MNTTYLEPTQAAGAELFTRGITGSVVVLNLLRLRETADYSENPELAREVPITGREAYQRYIDHTLPFLEASGGELLFLGEGGPNFIGPAEERWDLMMLVKQNSLQDFLAFAQNPDYLAGMGHRTAALEDSRLLPLVPFEGHSILRISASAGSDQ